MRKPLYSYHSAQEFFMLLDGSCISIEVEILATRTYKQDSVPEDFLHVKDLKTNGKAAAQEAEPTKNNEDGKKKRTRYPPMEGLTKEQAKKSIIMDYNDRASALRVWQVQAKKRKVPDRLWTLEAMDLVYGKTQDGSLDYWNWLE
ncbi:unnamed protein product [Symbiodinium microadriaticum]|nr:unnamed protein product [Symbiodinium microadriaticum]